MREWAIGTIVQYSSDVLFSQMSIRPTVCLFLLLVLQSQYPKSVKIALPRSTQYNAGACNLSVFLSHHFVSFLPCLPFFLIHFAFYLILLSLSWNNGMRCMSLYIHCSKGRKLSNLCSLNTALPWMHVGNNFDLSNYWIMESIELALETRRW